MYLVGPRIVTFHIARRFGLKKQRLAVLRLLSVNISDDAVHIVWTQVNHVKSRFERTNKDFCGFTPLQIFSRVRQTLVVRRRVRRLRLYTFVFFGRIGFDFFLVWDVKYRNAPFRENN